MINTQEDNTFAVIKHGLSRFLPMRIVLRPVDDKIRGLVEESFSMNTSKYHVRLWWSGKAYSVLGEHIIDAVADAEYNAKSGDIVIDPLSANCPVDIDWEKWTTATDKYAKRNAPFKLKELPQ